MKLSLSWIREWVALDAPAADVAVRLTMAGTEAEAEPATPALPTGVRVGKIVERAPHPNADKLSVCQVDVGDGKPRQIVCGAANARAGMLAPLALPGAKLPGGMEIGSATLRGVPSEGMLCSAKELALAEKSEGLLELDADAKPGRPIEQQLKLDDDVLALELTPNRGDCLGVLGLARELSAIYGVPLRAAPDAGTKVQETGTRRVEVKIEDVADCPNYAGRAITGVNKDARTPDWMRERLRRSGLRSISALVDITNYVMLELGQPMHAFDADRLQGAIVVRRARAGERLTLLNGQALELTSADLLITDDRGPLALGGVMGGAESEVVEGTTNVFLEAACFAPAAIAGTPRRHKLHTDAAYRYERGVDPALQRRALDRATALVVAICGGEPGPATHAGVLQPPKVTVSLRESRLQALLGMKIESPEVTNLLSRLGIGVKWGQGQWDCEIPSARYDLRIEADLVEEVARLHGYERIPSKPYSAALSPAPLPEAIQPPQRARAALAARGWQEAITWSFVDPKMQALVAPGEPAVALDNPMTETQAVMRTSVWSSLLPALLHNTARQAARVRLFELGAVYAPDGQGGTREAQRLAGVAWGRALPEQWDGGKRGTDFYDVKADLEALLPGLSMRPDRHPALHPGQCARVSRDGADAGWLGTLHPRLCASLSLAEPPVLFELDWATVACGTLPQHPRASDFPASRRDVAVIVQEKVAAADLLAVARAAAGPLLREALVFDQYRGAGLDAGCKSIALGLIFQDYSRTLTDDEIDSARLAVVDRLSRELGASVRQ